MASPTLLASLRMAGLAPAILAAGCVNAPTLPSGLGVPAAPAPTIFPVASKSTATLDCMAAAFKRAGVNPRRTMSMGSLANETVGQHTAVAPKVGKTEMPFSLRPFARNSLGRITAFRVMDDPPMERKDDKRGDSRDSRDDVVIPPLRLDGSIYFVSPFRVVEADAEALGFGARAKVEAYDIGVQLYWSMILPGSSTFEQVGTPVPMAVRVYSAEQGALAFRISSGNNGLVMANSTAQQDVSPHFAIQEAVNLGVSVLAGSFAAKFWGVAPSCEVPLVVAWDQDVTPRPIVDVTLNSSATQVCARVSDRRSGNNDKLLQEPPLMRVTELRADGIKIAERAIEVDSLSRLISGRKPVCINKAAFNERTEQVTIEFIGPRSGGRVLGSGTVFFQ